MSTAAPSRTYEMASVLFMDIVSYSLGSIDEQTELLTALQEVVRGTPEYQAASAGKDLVTLPTGDGMALVFLHDPVSSAKCALEIAAGLKGHPQIKLRMGLHIGPVLRHDDIRASMNVVGGGINMAQRVMDCGDAGHILMSQQVAEVLQQLRGWSESLQDLGIQQVKHGVQIHLYNLCKDGLGNSAVPKKLQAAAASGASDPATVRGATATTASETKSKSEAKGGGAKWIIGAAAVVLVAGGGLLATKWGDLFPAKKDEKIIAPAPPEHELRYYVTLQKYRDGRPYEQPLRLAREILFEKDYRIRLTVSSPESGYLYILNEGPDSTPAKPNLNTFFPAPEVSGGSARLAPGQEIQIPSKGFFVLDAQKGTEKLWLVWSEEALPEFEALKQWVNTTDRGTVKDADQARSILTELQKYAGAAEEPKKDDVNNLTILRGKGKVFARQIRLEHG